MTILYMQDSKRFKRMTKRSCRRFLKFFPCLNEYVAILIASVFPFPFLNILVLLTGYFKVIPPLSNAIFALFGVLIPAFDHVL